MSTGLTAEREAFLARLVAAGQDNPDGVGRAARTDRCRGCERTVLAGLDADRCAVAVFVDPHEIDHLGEFLALRLGLMTFTLRLGFNSKGTKRWELDSRFVCQIGAPRRTAVVAAHRCGFSVPPAAVPFLDSRRLSAGGAVPSGSSPPF